MPDGSWIRRLRGSIRSTSFEREMAAELELHIALETDALMARGVPAEMARAEAQRRFGSVALTADACRDSWGIRAVDALAQDLRFALRMITHCPGYTAVAVLTLSLGIGATTAVFSVVHAVLLRPLPYANGNALVEIRQQETQPVFRDLSLSAIELTQYRAEATSLDAIVEYHQMGFNLVDAVRPSMATRVVTGVVSADFFDVIGVKPLLGRGFRAADDAKDADPVLILSYPFWQTMFAGDPAILGRAVAMNDRIHTVVGVLPPVPQYPDDNDVYMPVAACPFRSAPSMSTDRTMRMVSAIGRMRSGVTIETTRSELAAIAARMASMFPGAYDLPAGFTTTAVSVREQLTARARPRLLLLLAASGFVLLLVCANAANITLARLVRRERELSIRAALGAGRGRVVRQLLTESFALAAAAGALAVVFASCVRDILIAFTARLTPLASEIAIDRSVLMFAVAVSAATAVLFGAMPALRYARPARPVRSDVRSRRVLIAAQVAISFMLLVGAGLMVRSFVNLQNADGGFRTDHVLTTRLDLDWVKYDTRDKRRVFFNRLLSRIQAQSSVTHAAISLTFPLNPSTPFDTELVIEGRSVENGEPRPQADLRMVSPEYFETIGMRVLRGRAFGAGDAAGAPPVAIVNDSMARHQFGGTDIVGRRVSFDGGAHWSAIVGVVNDVRQYGLASPPVDEVYVPFDQQGPLSARVLVRTTGDPKPMLQAVERIAHEIDPLQPLSHSQTLEQVRRSSLASPRATTLLVALLAVLALLITAAGIAGVVACNVSERSAEIGIRMALGARAGSVVRMVAVEAFAPVVAGAACGLAGALVMARALARLLYGVGPHDLLTYLAVVTVLSCVAGLACLPPARRAARIDPIRALRAE